MKRPQGTGVIDVMGHGHMIARRIRIAVCEAFGVEYEALKTRRRFRELVIPRQVIMALQYEHCKAFMSSSFVAAQFNLDHSDVFHAIKVVNNLIETDDEMRKIILKIKLKAKLINEE